MYSLRAASSACISPQVVHLRLLPARQGKLPPSPCARCSLRILHANCSKLSNGFVNMNGMKSILTACLCFLGCLLAGCSASGLNSVTGEIFVDGNPAEGALVIFHPLNSEAKFESGYPRGITDAQGRFQLSTEGTNDGAPEGNYAVIVIWHAGSPADEEREETATPPDRLQGKYATPELSPLRAEIKSGPNVIPAFQLQGGKP